MSKLEIELHNPVAWPANRAKEGGTKQALWKRGGMQLTFYQAEERLLEQVDAITKRGKPWRTKNCRLSTNVVIAGNGRPHRGRSSPTDPAAVFSFELDGNPIALPCDRFDRVEDNIAAIAAHIEALRGQERWGVGSISQAFAGYQALPPPGAANDAIAGQPPRRSWSEVFTWPAGEPLTAERLNSEYRRLAKERQHDPDALRELNIARDEAREELERG